MPNNIDEFLSKTKQFGLAKTNKFLVHFETMNFTEYDVGVNEFGTDVSKLNNNTLGDRLAFSVEMTNLPGKSIMTTDVKTNAPYRKNPYGSTYHDVNMTFRVGRDMLEKIYFDLWQEKIVHTKSNLVGFYDDYTRDILIHQLDEGSTNHKQKGEQLFSGIIRRAVTGLGTYIGAGEYANQAVDILTGGPQDRMKSKVFNDNINVEFKNIYTVRLKRAFPIVVSDLQLNNDDQNQFHRLQITWAFEKWEYVRSTPAVDFYGVTGVGRDQNPVLDASINSPQYTDRVQNQIDGFIQPPTFV